MPTILGRLGVKVAAESKPSLAGLDIFAEALGKRYLFFTCWFERRCRGFIRGTDKVVRYANLQEDWYLNLETDPAERDPTPNIPARLAAVIPVMHQVLNAHRNLRWPVTWDPVPYPSWQCPKNQPCTHPNARPIIFE